MKKYAVVLLVGAMPLTGCSRGPSAEEILQTMESTYASCQSYQDTGTYKSPLKDGRFSTVFVKPDRFRFDFDSTMAGGGANGSRPGSMGVVWRRGEEAVLYHRPPNGVAVPEPKRFVAAIGGATGISAGVAAIVPHMLFPEDLREWGGVPRRDLKRIDDAPIGPTDCYRIRARAATGLNTFWVEKSTFLLRRVELERDVTTVIDYEPKLDGQVSDDRLELNVPRP